MNFAPADAGPEPTRPAPQTPAQTAPQPAPPPASRAPRRTLERVQDEPAFVLHRHDWSESSQILDVFSRQHGRVALLAKGVKRPGSQMRAVLLALLPLRLSWSGAGEVRSLKAAHWPGGQLLPPAAALAPAYYLNELLLKLLPREDAHPELFDHYAQAIAWLAQGQGAAAVLRAFELLLLRELGWLGALNQEAATAHALQAAAPYQWRAQQGLCALGAGGTEAAAVEPACAGALWLALHAALSQGDPWPELLALCQSERSGALRQQLRAGLHYHSGMREFQTRRWLQLGQRAQPGAAAVAPGLVSAP